MSICMTLNVYLHGASMHARSRGQFRHTGYTHWNYSLTSHW
jgi:hypothetical protein